MGLFNILDPGLNYIFSPLLKLPSVIGLLIVSAIITFIITIIYKYTTDQQLLKSVRDKQKKLQEEMKKSRDNPKKLMKLQREAMSSSMEMMRESFKSMLYTFIPILILFGWIATHFAFAPLTVNEEFKINVMLEKDLKENVEINVPEGLSLLSDKKIDFTEKKASFSLKADKEGIYNVTFKQNNLSYEKKIVVGPLDSNLKDKKMKHGLMDYIYGSTEGYLPESNIFYVEATYDRITPLQFTQIPWIKTWGWLGTYIIFSIGLSILLRKLMKVY